MVVPFLFIFVEVLRDSVLNLPAKNNKIMDIEEYMGEKVVYDEWGQYIYRCKGDNQSKILSLRGWGTIQKMFKTQEEAYEFQDSIGEWIADAINQKLKNYQRS